MGNVAFSKIQKENADKLDEKEGRTANASERVRTNIVIIYVKGRCVIGSLARVIKKNCILLLTLTYGSDLDMEQGTTVKSVWCGNELSVRSMWCDKMGG